MSSEHHGFGRLSLEALSDLVFHTVSGDAQADTYFGVRQLSVGFKSLSQYLTSIDDELKAFQQGAYQGRAGRRT